MAMIHLIRHGNAAKTSGESTDPGLDALGHDQASAMSEVMGPIGPLSLISSPLQRARDTSAPLERAWDTNAAIEPRVTEIPSPTKTRKERSAWLRAAMDKEWNQLGDGVAEWRRGILDVIGALSHDTAIVTHFMVINIAAGAAMDDDRLVIFWPDNCSQWAFETTASGLKLVSQGKQLETKIG